MKTIRITIFLFLLILIQTIVVPSSAQDLPSFEGQIAYIGTDNNLWIIQGESGENYQITNDASEQIQYLEPRYSPDGTMLAYCQVVKGDPINYNLFISRIGEWQPILITDNILCRDWPDQDFDWSPDSTKIIYNRVSTLAQDTESNGSRWSSYYGIWMVDITTGKISEIIPPPNHNPLLNPAWSPDGAWMKFYESAYFASLGSLLTGHNDTGTIYQWVGASSVWPGYSDWAPDGSNIVFDEVPYAGFPGAGLYVATPNGENIENIYRNYDYMAINPLWSPDGSTIAFRLKSPNSDESSLALIAPDGSNPQIVFSTESALFPSVWSPSGNQILFTKKGEQYLELFIYEKETGNQIAIGQTASAGSDWTKAVMGNVKAQEPITIPDFPYSESLLIYIAPDNRLVLYDPNDGSEINLTNPLAATNFIPSPSGHRYIYGRHLASIEFLENDELMIQETLLPAAPVGDTVNWSLDETRFSFRDWRGSFWIADANEEAQQIPEATSLPSWSSDGALISFCVNGGALRVIGGDIQETEIAKKTDCNAHWSPTKNILAFTMLPEDERDQPQVFLFDSMTGKKKMVFDGGEVIGWSPDGRFLAMKESSSTDAPKNDYTIFVTNPEGDKLLKVGSFNKKGVGKSEWILTDSGHLFGHYAIAPDLSSTRPIADAVIDSSKNGTWLLVSNPELDLQVLACQNSGTGDQVRLLTVDLANISTDQLPGIWGWMSPVGLRVVNRIYVDGNFANLLLNCGDGTQMNLPFAEFPDIASFSADGNWFIVTNSHNGDQVHVILSNLEDGGIERIAISPGSNSAWVRALDRAGIHTVTGQVSLENGKPLPRASVFVDGILITTTDDSGNFTITRLLPGEHEITIQKPGFLFSPSSYSISLPPDIDDIKFEAKKGKAPEEKATSTPTSEPYLGPLTTPGNDKSNQESSSTNSPIIDYLVLIYTILKQLISGIISSYIVPYTLTTLSLVDTRDGQMVLGGMLIALILLVSGILVIRSYRRRSLAAEGKPSEPTTPTTIKIEPTPEQPSTPATVSTPAPSVGEPKPETPPQAPVPPPVPAMDDQIKIWLQEGTSQVRAGNYDEGYNILRKVVQEKPDEAGAWLWLGYLAARKEDWRSAERCFRIAKSYHHPKADKALHWLDEQKK